MELDTIIYVLITIAIFVISLLGQTKKKKIEKIQVEENLNYSLNDFEKILLRKEEFRSAEKTDEKLEIEESRETEHENHSKKEPETKSNFKAEEKETNDGFDIKSAIIYSSILERKKFRR